MGVRITPYLTVDYIRGLFVIGFTDVASFLPLSPTLFLKLEKKDWC